MPSDQPQGKTPQALCCHPAAALARTQGRGTEPAPQRKQPGTASLPLRLLKPTEGSAPRCRSPSRRSDRSFRFTPLLLSQLHPVPFQQHKQKINSFGGKLASSPNSYCRCDLAAMGLSSHRCTLTLPHPHPSETIASHLSRPPGQAAPQHITQPAWLPREAPAIVTALIPNEPRPSGTSLPPHIALQSKLCCYSASRMAHARPFVPLAPEKPWTSPGDGPWLSLTLLRSSSIERAHTEPAAQRDGALSPTHFGASYFDLEVREAKQHRPLKAE